MIGNTFEGGRKSLVAAALVGAFVLASCTNGASAGTSGGNASSRALQGSITVSAASSLTGSFDALGTRFESAHPGTTVRFNYGSSATLLDQIKAGAPADVFASASPTELQEAVRAGDIAGRPVSFARNTLVIVTKPGNPLHIRSLADLTKVPVVAVCVHSAPCGAASARALRRARVTLPTPQVTLGQDVKTTLEAVSTGEADAGIVYVTDAAAIGSAVTPVRIGPAHNVVTSYFIGVVKSTSNATLARAWVTYVRGPAGQRVLGHAGFLPPAR